MERAPYAPPCAAIDFETAESAMDSACSIGIAIVREGRIESLETRLLRPPTRKFQFTWVRRLAWKDVRHAQRVDIVWAEFSTVL